MRKLLVTAGFALTCAAPLLAQQQTPPPAALPMPAIGDMAPDFEIRGATRYGLLAERPMLSQLRGQTVVLAFFVIARTRG